MKFGLQTRTLLILLLALSFLQTINTTETIAQAGLDTEAAPENRRDFSGLSKLPLEFIENRGQWGDAAKFVAQRGPTPASFYNDRIKLHLGSDQSAELMLTFEGASKKVRLAGEGKRSGYHNFFFGNDPKRWHAKVASFSSVLYSGLYPGVDMRVREEASKLEYDLILAPGADIARVAIRVDGASEIEIAGDGSLILPTAHGSVRQTPPLTWEETPAGERQPVACRFRKIDARRYGFEVSGRNPEHTLVIDPGLEWSTFLGGGGHDAVYDMALARDGSGDVVLIGFTRSFDFPRTNGSLGPLGQAPFVARLNASGTRLIYSTLFGGSGVDSALGLAVDSSSAPVVVGNTNSSDFPVTPGAYDTTYNGDYDAFVSRFNPTNGQLVFASYLGGTRSDPSKSRSQIATPAEMKYR